MGPLAALPILRQAQDDTLALGGSRRSRCEGLAAGDGDDDLDAVARGERRSLDAGARNDGVVAGDGHAVAAHAERVEERAERAARRNLARLAVDLDRHRQARNATVTSRP